MSLCALWAYMCLSAHVLRIDGVIVVLKVVQQRGQGLFDVSLPYQEDKGICLRVRTRQQKNERRGKKPKASLYNVNAALFDGKNRLACLLHTFCGSYSPLIWYAEKLTCFILCYYHIRIVYVLHRTLNDNWTAVELSYKYVLGRLDISKLVNANDWALIHISASQINWNFWFLWHLEIAILETYAVTTTVSVTLWTSSTVAIVVKFCEMMAKRRTLLSELLYARKLLPARQGGSSLQSRGTSIEIVSIYVSVLKTSTIAEFSFTLSSLI